MMGKKILTIISFVAFSTAGGYSAARAADISPRDQSFLLSSKKTYEYYCSPCHGTGGKGDGTFFTIDLKPKPRNFTDVEYMKKRTDDQLAKSITDGSKAVDKSNLCPPWGKTISEKRVKELVAYIRGFSSPVAEQVASVAKEGKVVAEKPSTFKSSLRWFFLAVVTIALAGGAVGELKKLKKESL
ncbi:MAG: cytochrome c [Candidatus Brocadiaceae bacterium]